MLKSIRNFIRNHHPHKRWKKFAPYRIFESPSLSQTIKKKYVPLWFKSFSDPINGGFYERLDQNLNPLPMGYKRLLSQCRQIYLYTESDTNPRSLLPQLSPSYNFLNNHYKQGDGRWVFACADDGTIYDSKYDFYAHAFLILCLTTYGKASQNNTALSDAKDTLRFIQTSMKHPTGRGYEEALDTQLNPIPQMRRQNPHMHFFEACLFAYESTRDEDYANECHYLYELFKDYFFDTNTHTLREFFDDALNFHETEGHKVEAGHHFEWVWLLDFYTKLFPDRTNDATPYINHLYNWACTHGYDPNYGGIFDACDPAGKPIQASKRIWPLCEAIRAHRVMRDRDPRAVPLLESTKKTLKTKYLKPSGAWIESWEQDFKKPHADYLPATSVYHL